MYKRDVGQRRRVARRVTRAAGRGARGRAAGRRRQAPARAAAEAATGYAGETMIMINAYTTLYHQSPFIYLFCYLK